jgi:hypothetical protein
MSDASINTPRLNLPTGSLLKNIISYCVILEGLSDFRYSRQKIVNIDDMQLNRKKPTYSL